MIEMLVSSYRRFWGQVAAWYHTSDLLTQYLVIIVSALLVVLLTMAMYLSNRTK